MRARIIGAWILLIGATIGWPVSALTVAKEEPPFILGLSWLAIILTAVDILATQDVRKQEETDEEG